MLMFALESLTLLIIGTVSDLDVIDIRVICQTLKLWPIPLRVLQHIDSRVNLVCCGPFQVTFVYTDVIIVDVSDRVM